MLGAIEGGKDKRGREREREVGKKKERFGKRVEERLKGRKEKKGEKERE